MPVEYPRRSGSAYFADDGPSVMCMRQLGHLQSLDEPAARSGNLK